MKVKLFVLGLIFLWAPSFAQEGYSSYEQLGVQLKNLSSKTKLSKVSSIGKSSSGQDIWLVTLAKGDATKKKAILIVAGADGRHPAGVEIAAGLAENFASSSTLESLLEDKTIYIIPCLSPDAFTKSTVIYERSGNAITRDDDRDGYVDEDPFEDLNIDGLITMMRIEDATGNYVVSSEHDLLMVKANAEKGEKGKYLLITEGVDNDKDGLFNEDGPGAVNIDKNFTYQYPIFENGSGEYAASEPETRAFLDFLYKNHNIHSVFHFGLSNNLSEPMKYDRMKASKRMIESILEKDADVASNVSRMYSNANLRDAPGMPQTPGNLTQTAYFHAGRFSYSTPGWWVPKEKPAEEAAEKPAPGSRMPKPAAGSPELDYIKWAEANSINSFVEWTAINHPDFPNNKVEVGGFKPYVLNNPPISFLGPVIENHRAFLNSYLDAMPKIEIVNQKVESLGNGVNRVTIVIKNTGSLPTYSEMGDKIKFMYKVSAKLNPAKGQSIISGLKNNFRSALDAGEFQEYSWLINGKGKLGIEAGCPTAGIETLILDLK